MKSFLLLLFSLVLCASGSARADSGISCLTHHEDAAGTLVGKILLQAVTTGLAKKGIALRSADTSFDVSANQVDFEYDGVYGYFDLGDGMLKSESGTSLSVDFASQDPVSDAHPIHPSRANPRARS